MAKNVDVRFVGEVVKGGPSPSPEELVEALLPDLWALQRAVPKLARAQLEVLARDHRAALKMVEAEITRHPPTRCQAAPEGER